MPQSKLFLVAGMVGILAGFYPVASSQEPRQVVLAVFDVDDKGAGLTAETVSNLTDYLVVLLTGAGYLVVPREQVKERILEAKKETYKACYDQACQIELGRELAADKAFTTQLIKVGKKCRLASLLLDLKKATTEKSFAVPSDCGEENLLEAVEKLVQGFSGQAAEPSPATAAEPGVGTVRTPPAESEKDVARVPADRFAAAGTLDTRVRGGAAFLGVAVRALDPRTESIPGLDPERKGLLVAQVVGESPAARAGLKAGDVILSVNGIRTDNPVVFSRLVQRLGVGGRMELELWRAGASSMLQVTLEAAPTAAQTTGQPPPRPQPQTQSLPPPPPQPEQKPQGKPVPVVHGHLGFQIGPTFEKVGPAAELSDVSLDGENGTFSADISPGTGFFLEVSLDAHTDNFLSVGIGLLYLFNNKLLDEGDRISYLAPTLLGRLTLAFTDWLETRTVMQLGCGVHLGSRFTLETEQEVKKTITQWWDMEMIFFKAGQEIVYYITDDIGLLVTFGMLFSSGSLDIQGKEYHFGLPVILFLSAGVEMR